MSGKELILTPKLSQQRENLLTRRSDTENEKEA